MMSRIRMLSLGRRLLMFSALTLSFPVSAASQHFPPDDELRLMLRYLVEDGEAAGVVLGVLEADGSTRVVSYGSAGSGGRPLGPRSVFEIGSVNKTFTGTLLADMVAKGEVALTDPISRYLPQGVTAPRRDGREITLLDLATHHSGLPRLPDNHTPADRANPYIDFTLEKLYAFLSGHQLRRDPGSAYEYSNVGMGLLGHLLARASKRSYEDLVRQRILEPLGMNMTGYPLDGEIAQWMTKGHDAKGNEVPYWFATETIQGAGGLRSNVEDMLKYLKANVGTPATDLQRAMRVAHETQKPIDGGSIGLAWMIRPYQGRRVVMHGGNTAGFSTDAGFDPDKRVGFVLLANQGQFGDDVGSDFLRRGLPLAIPEVAVARTVLERYVGEYEMAPGRNFVIRLEKDGWLTLQAPGNVRFRLYAESDTKFFTKRAPWRVTFTKAIVGEEITGFVADLEGTERNGRKISSDGPPPRVVAGNAIPEQPITAADIARYEGTYTLETIGKSLDIRIFGENGELKAQPAGQSVSRLLPVGRHQFVLAADSRIRLVFGVQGDRAESVTLQQGSSAFTGKRKQ
jgi:serine-type D-Ala-D-Ala carboxypeptidase/endopeptidase